GLFAGTLLHLVFGSPGGLPTLGRVQNALRSLDVDLTDLHTKSIEAAGVVILEGTDSHGVVEGKGDGRDAGHVEFVAAAWRGIWSRGNTRRFRLSRGEYVEHEGFMTFLAQRAGVRVPDIVSAGLADNGDALIALRPAGTALSDDHGSLTPAQ